MENNLNNTKVEIISIGEEVLDGSILDTNTRFISKELMDMGISVNFHSTVGDNENDMLYAFEQAIKRSNLIFTIGGLGPTEDDLTKEVMAKALGKKLIKLSHDKQEDLIDSSLPLKNTIGTAPGVYYKDKDLKIFLLPGPPGELMDIFEKEIRSKIFGSHEITSMSLYIVGLPEVRLEKELQQILGSSEFSWATYPHSAYVEFKIKGPKDRYIQMKDTYNYVKKSYWDKVLYENEESLEKHIYNTLLKNKLKLSTVESFTGGKLAASLLELDGASQVFYQGFISYDSSAKVNSLGIDSKIIDKYGTVSEEVSVLMAENVHRMNESGITISTTGVAGPARDEKNNPVGKAFITICDSRRKETKELNLKGTRNTIQTLGVIHSWILLSKFMSKYY